MQERTDKTADYGLFEFINVLEPVTGSITVENGFPRPTDKHTYRDLRELSPERDALIAGTMPEELVAFEGAPNVIALGGVTGASIYRGNKLGHAFYKLRDREPASDKKVRTLLGYEMPLRLNRDYLTPLFRSPKDEATGQFDPKKVDWWILAAPSTLPKGGELVTRRRFDTGHHDRHPLRQVCQ